MSKGGFLVSYLFNSPLSILSHPNSIQPTLKKITMMKDRTKELLNRQ